MEDQTHTVELTLTEYFFDKVRDVFDLELEILQGDHLILDDGRHYCKIEVNGYKVAMFKDFIRSIMSIPTQDVSVKIMGHLITKN